LAEIPIRASGQLKVSKLYVVDRGPTIHRDRMASFRLAFKKMDIGMERLEGRIRGRHIPFFV
jgi:hypothetical protein